MKSLVFVLSLFCLGFGAGKAEAQPASQVCVPPEAPKSECSTDAECEKDGNSCTAPKCNLTLMDWKCAPGTSMADGTTGVSWTIGKCVVPEIPIANCDCTKKYPNPGQDKERRCCKKGYDEAVDPAAWKCCLNGYEEGDPAKWKCCHENVVKNIDPGTPANPTPCKDCPKCPNCPLPPKIDCDLIGDPKIKSCCVAKGSLLWFVMDACIPDGPGGKEGCENIAKDIDNSGVFQQCCLINNGVINGDINMCNNITTGGGPGGATTGGTGTTPEGSASALTCSVALVGAPVDGKFAITYTVPNSAGPVVSATLTQLSGSQIKVEGEAEPSDFGATVTAPKSMSTKTISDPNNPPSFTVYAPTPKSMVGEWKAPFEVKVSLATLDGETGSALCTEDHFLHAEGTGCGCSMTATLTTREQVAAYLVLSMCFGLTLLSLRVVRGKAKRQGSQS